MKAFKWLHNAWLHNAWLHNIIFNPNNINMDDYEWLFTDDPVDPEFESGALYKMISDDIIKDTRFSHWIQEQMRSRKIVRVNRWGFVHVDFDYGVFKQYFYIHKDFRDDLTLKVFKMKVLQ